MTSWADFENAAPGFAARVRELFTSHRHHTMATLRRDGSPRISGTEVEFAAGDIRVGMMAGTRRAGDLRRDGRVAIHSHTVDPPPAGGDPGSWCGDAKISGTAHEVAGADDGGDADRFGVEIGEVVLTRVGTPADHLVIEVWTPGAGLVRIERR
ncbi:MAG TPA: pyridoxamine 5'-phosphate oxidase family protein [Propionibacteriaceae bacterium]|nr:pyridoxamine 5'-phosphate oxidase family protein [Propionibacteriaceae bacterium]